MFRESEKDRVNKLNACLAKILSGMKPPEEPYSIAVGGQEPPAYLRIIGGSRQVADFANSVYV